MYPHWVYMGMEERLEALLAEQMRDLTAPSSRVEVSFNGTSLLRQPTTNRDAPVLGVETLNFIIMCARPKHKQDAMELAQKVKGRLSGLRPQSIDPLFSAIWCPTLSYVGLVEDSFHQVALTAALTRPYIQEIKIC